MTLAVALWACISVAMRRDTKLLLISFNIFRREPNLIQHRSALLPIGEFCLRKDINTVTRNKVNQTVITSQTISVNWTFSLGITAEALRANIGWISAISLQQWPVYPKFQVEGVAPTHHSSSQNTRLNVLSYGIKNLDWFFFRFVTILIARARLHSMQRGNK